MDVIPYLGALVPVVTIPLFHRAASWARLSPVTWIATSLTVWGLTELWLDTRLVVTLAAQALLLGGILAARWLREPNGAAT